MSEKPIIKVNQIVKTFHSSRKLFSRSQDIVRAVVGVDLQVNYGETLGLVGESGCGKSTLGNCIMRILQPDSGDVLCFDDDLETKNIYQMDAAQQRILQRKMQIVFQDPYSSINPRMTVRDVVGEPLMIQKLCKTRREYEDRVAEMLDVVGLEGSAMERYPHAFSGGQRQRICIARALVTKPKFILCDEAVSALDVSVRAQVLNLLLDLQHTLNLSYLFISHDLSVVRYVSHRVAIMYLGRIVEEGSVDDVFDSPMHPYTKLLLSAIPIPNPEKKHKNSFSGLIDINETGETQGCCFRPRCPRAVCECETKAPEMVNISGTHRFACFNPE